MRLPESYRQSLKEPFGVLISDADATYERIRQEIPDDSCIITVGDHTTEKILRLGMVPGLQITDGLERRRRRPHPPLGPSAKDNADLDAVHSQSSSAVVVDVTNPPGEITQQSILAIRRAFSSAVPVRIRVSGEEDLLVIPACIYAPENSTVLYGQPGEGLVITVIDSEIRNKTRQILESMGRT